jgi:phosphoglycolate phosphatase-like HAD superfamily hydrolase
LIKPNNLIAVDFDGTLHDSKHPVEGKKMGPPMPGALEAIEELQDRGYGIIVFTVNNPKVVGEWLEYYGFDDFIVTNTKPNAMFYIDDRAIRHTDWAGTIMQLDGLTGYVEE